MSNGRLVSASEGFYVPYQWSIDGTVGYAAPTWTWRNHRPRLEGVRLYNGNRDYRGYVERWNLPLSEIRYFEKAIKQRYPSIGK